MKENPKLTIITVNLNNKNGLRKTIESVVAQTTREFEYIVIDGGSTDGSVEIIKEFEEYIDYWISESDKGIYHAMNKGVQAAHGEYCQFLNSGDWLYSPQIVEIFCNIKNRTDIILGVTAHHLENKVITGRRVNDSLNLFDILKGEFNHQSSFISTKLCKEVPYDESYKICSDWKFFIDALIFKNCSFSTINEVVVNFDMNGISNTNRALLKQERNQIIASYNIPPRVKYIFDNMDSDSFEISAKLHNYDGFRKFLYQMDRYLLMIYIIARKIF